VVAPDWLLAKPFAHRGLHDQAKPENSLAAIDAAITAGYPVEIDVQVSADRRAVVFHDWNLQRLTGQDAKVADVTSAGLAKLRLHGTEEKIPLLEDVLDVMAGRQAVLVEIKSPRQPTALEPEVSRILRGYRGPLAIQSFNPFTLGWFRHHHPEILRGQISCSFDTDDMAGWKKLILAHYGMNWMSQPHFLAHHWRDLPAVAPSLLRRVFGLPLLVWTVRSAEEQPAALRWADNMIFEGFVPDSK